MEQKNWKNNVSKIIVLAVGVLGIGGYFTYAQMTKVTPLFEDKTYELGKVSISENVEDYIVAQQFMMEKAILDISSVNPNEVGVYVVSCDVKDKHFEYNIHIVDTTGPTIAFREEGSYGTYNEYSIEDFATASDLSEITKFDMVSYDDESGNPTAIDNNTFVLEDAGTYTLEFVAEDIFGNTTNKTKNIDVLEAPHFILLNDRQYQVDSNFSLTDFVYAEDKDGNDITDKITITSDKDFDISTPGEYEVTYSVVDEDAIERTQTIDIKVGEYEDNDYGFDISQDNLSILIDHGHFQYEPLVDNDSLDDVIALTSPTSFSLKYVTETYQGTCTCYIYKLTPEKIYFVTNKHCTSFFNHTDSLEFYDFEGVYFTFQKSDVEITKSETRDIAYFTMPISYFDTDQLLKYKEALIDWDIYDSVEIGEKVLCNTQAWGFETGTIKDYCTAATLNSLDRTALDDYEFKYPSVCTNEAFLRNGMSGSPLYNYDGYLIATAESVYYNGNKRADAFVRLDDLYALVQDIE